MISDSFLRNLNITRLLTAVSIQKNKLKETYARAIKSALNENRRKNIEIQRLQHRKFRSQDSYQLNEKQNNFNSIKQKKQKKENQNLNEKSKTPLHFIDFKFVPTKYVATKTQRKQRNQSFPLKNLQKIVPETEKSKQKNKIFSVKHHKKQQKQRIYQKTLQSTQRDADDGKAYLTSLYNFEFIEQNNDFCLQNKEIVRCSSAGGQISKFILKRQQTLRKSTLRGKTLTQVIKLKYGKLANNKKVQ